jgi:hypothetical protein
MSDAYRERGGGAEGEGEREREREREREKMIFNLYNICMNE